MKTTIFGFDQQRLLSIGVDTTDIILLKWVLDATGSTKMQHIEEEGRIFVWASHNKVLSDYPILNIKKDMLSKRFSKLVNIGLLDRKMKKNLSGMKVFYGRTELFDSLLYSEMVKDSDFENVTNYNFKAVTNYGSDNKLYLDIDKSISKKDNNKNTTNVVLRQSRKTTSSFLQHHSSLPKQSQNLYSKCVAQINDFTSNKKTKSLLLEYLDLRLEKGRDIGKPLYANMWKGMLKKLADFSDTEKIKVIQQSIELGYMSFYPLNSKSSKVNVDDMIVKNIATKEEKEARRSGKTKPIAIY